jgi:hypothetical protein
MGASSSAHCLTTPITTKTPNASNNLTYAPASSSPQAPVHPVVIPFTILPSSYFTQMSKILP